MLSTVALAPKLKCPDALDFEAALRKRFIGQDEAVAKLSEILQIFRAGYHDPKKPISTVLSLGPTGTGKTELVLAAADILFGTDKAVFRIDCGEYQDSYQVNRSSAHRRDIRI
jgi:ATP-dependent Clp protease ATP-binding subunit ClpB